MIKLSNQAELDAVLAAADAMCVAARTAPKTRGMDFVHTAVVTGDEKEELAAKMEEMAAQTGMDFLRRDAGNLRASAAVVLIGVENVARGLNGGCRYCGFEDCGACVKLGGRCAYTSMDLGIAVGSAVSVAADARLDNRVMFSIGRAALEMKLLGEKAVQVLGIPLSASGKSPFFDRKKS